MAEIAVKNPRGPYKDLWELKKGGVGQVGWRFKMIRKVCRVVGCRMLCCASLVTQLLLAGNFDHVLPQSTERVGPRTRRRRQRRHRSSSSGGTSSRLRLDLYSEAIQVDCTIKSNLPLNISSRMPPPPPLPVCCLDRGGAGLHARLGRRHDVQPGRQCLRGCAPHLPAERFPSFLVLRPTPQRRGATGQRRNRLGCNCQSPRVGNLKPAPHPGQPAQHWRGASPLLLRLHLEALLL